MKDLSGARFLCRPAAAFVAALTISVATLVATLPMAYAQRHFGNWTISELQPDIQNGGRANTIAVNPINDNDIFVASETGGLFHSIDRGLSWKHVETLPVFSTNAVAFLPKSPGVVLVTTNPAFEVNNRGGIWRSTDGGATWVQSSPPITPLGVTDRFAAWDISVAEDTGNIFVGNSYGVSISTDQGANWTLVTPFSAVDPDRHVFAVIAQIGNLIIVGGPAGLRRSTNNGVTWSAPSSGVSNILAMHALSRSPYTREQAYVVNADSKLYYTEDAGDHWAQIAAAPVGAPTCGGIPFVKASGLNPTTGLDLYFGNHCDLFKLSATPAGGPEKYNYAGQWIKMVVDHIDTRDLAFDNNNVPLLLATDGGLHNTVDAGLHWSFVGGGHAGYNALQITEVRGQWVTDLGLHHLYFGTQDNQLWASADGGKTWPYSICGEGYYLERQNRVATSSDSKITFGCPLSGNFASDPLFTNVTLWPDAPGPYAGSPKVIQKFLQVQGVEASGSMARGLRSTVDGGSSWQQYAVFPEDRRDLPKQSGNLLAPVLYQPVRTGWDATNDFEINHLVRISAKLSYPETSVSYPAMINFGGLGINPTMFAWYQVYDVDPLDSDHLIAPDVVSQKMMETHDGGDHWNEIPQLTSLVTGAGQFLFRSSIFPHASVVTFSPDDPTTVAVGTWQGGMMISGDRGATWSKVPGTERMTHITSVDWRTPNDAIVSTYGRGLWRLNWQLYIPWIDFVKYCRLPCIVEPFQDRGGPVEKYAKGVLVFNGHVQGARVLNGMLQELFVWPGSTVAFISDFDKVGGVKVTETTKTVRYANVEGVLRAPGREYQTVGFLLGRTGNVQGTVFSRKTLLISDTVEARRDTERSAERRKSPTAGKPYVRIVSEGVSSSNIVTRGQRVNLSGDGFRRNTKIEIAVDGRTVQTFAVKEDGEFLVNLLAPQQLGLHRITASDSGIGKVIDGVMIIVREEDTEKGGGRVERRSPTRDKTHAK